jgi:hypothetical protein
MSEFVSNVEVAAIKAELAALRRENEVLHKWLDEQKRHAAELRQILLNRGDAK